MRLSAGISVSETGGVCNKAEVGKAERKSAGNSGFLNRVRKFDSCRGHPIRQAKDPLRWASLGFSAAPRRTAQNRWKPLGTDADWRIAGARYCPSTPVVPHRERSVGSVPRDDLPIFDVADVGEDDGLVTRTSWRRMPITIASRFGSVPY